MLIISGLHGTFQTADDIPGDGPFKTYHARRKGSSDGQNFVIHVHDRTSYHQPLYLLKAQLEKLCSLHHPRLRNIVDFQCTAEMIAIVCDHPSSLPFESAWQQLRVQNDDFQFVVLRMLDVMIRMSEILSFCHDQGILHGGLKMRSFSVIETSISGQDLQLSDLHETLFPSLRNSHLLSNLPYLSPEQIGYLNVDLPHAMDVYSLGMIGLQMLNGYPPFLDQDKEKTVFNILNHQAIVVDRPEIPNMLRTVLGKMIRKNPNDRYQTMKGLIYDLRLVRESFLGKEQLFALGKQDPSRELNPAIGMVGRSKQLFFLREFLYEAGLGQGRCLALGARSGTGKTRLAQEFMREAASRGCRIYEVKFTQFETNLPLSVPMRLFPMLAKEVLKKDPDELMKWSAMVKRSLGPTGYVLSKRLPQLQPILPEFEPIPAADYEAEMMYFRKNMAKLLCMLSSDDQATIIFIDDLHWADEPSLLFFNELVRLSQESRLGKVLLIMAFRSEEVSELHPFQKLVLSTMRDQEVIHLSSLDRHESDDLVESLLDENSTEVEKIKGHTFNLTQGNPLYIQTYLSLLLEHQIYGMDTQGHYVFNANKARQFEVDKNQQFFPEKRLLNLSENALQLISLMAVAGSKVEQLTIEFLLDCEQKRVAELDGRHQTAVNFELSLGELMYKQLVFREGAHLVFCHDRIRDAAWNLCDSGRKKQLHDDYVDFILIHKGEHIDSFYPEAVFELAFHLLNGNMATCPERNRKILFVAGKKSALLHAYPRAKSYLTEALVFYPNMDQRREGELFREWIELNEVLADVLIRTGDNSSSIQIYGKLVELSVDDPYRVAILCSKLSNCYLFAWNMPMSLEWAKKGLNVLGVSYVSKISTAYRVILLNGTGFWLSLLWFFFGKKRVKKYASKREQIAFRLQVEVLVSSYFLSPLVSMANGINVFRKLVHYEENYERQLVIGLFSAVLEMFNFKKLARLTINQSITYFQQHYDPFVLSLLYYSKAYNTDFPSGDLKAVETNVKLATRISEATGDDFNLIMCLLLMHKLASYGYKSQEAPALEKRIETIVKRQPTKWKNFNNYLLRFKLERGQYEEFNRDVMDIKEELASNPRQYLSLEMVLAYAYLGESLLLSDRFEEAKPYFKQVLKGVMLSGHSHAISLLYVALQAKNFIRNKELGKAIFPLMLSIISVLRGDPMFAPQRRYVWGEFWHALGWQSLGSWLVRSGISFAYKRAWVRVVAEGEFLLGEMLWQRDPLLAEKFLLGARSYYVQANFPFWIEKIDVLLFKIAHQKQEILGDYGISEEPARHEKIESIRGTLELKALTQMFIELNVLKDKESLYQSIIDTMKTLSGADTIAIFLRLREEFQLVGSLGLGAEKNIGELLQSSGVDAAYVDQISADHSDHPIVVPLVASSLKATGAQSIMLVPLKYKGKLIGLIYLGSRMIRGLFDSHSFDVIHPIATQMAICIESFEQLAAVESKAKLDAEIEYAKAFQQTLIPTNQLPSGIDFAWFYQPADKIGGDWFANYFDRKRNIAFFYIGDVTGHGFASALAASMISGFISSWHHRLESQFPGSRLYAPQQDTASLLLDVAREANRMIIDSGGRVGLSMSMCFLALDLAAQEVVWISAGHPSPFLIRGRRAIPLTAQSPILGMSHDIEFKIDRHNLEKDDIFFLYTDGLLDRVGQDHRRMRIRQVSRILSQDKLPQELLDQLMAEAKTVWQEAVPSDDITLLAIQCHGDLTDTEESVDRAS